MAAIPVDAPRTRVGGRMMSRAHLIRGESPTDGGGSSDVIAASRPAFIIAER